MRFRLAFASAAALAVCIPAGYAAAHHSMAMFDQQHEMTVTGVVREFQWSNPHAYIQVVSTDSEGREVEWSLEMGAPMYLYARGWRPSSLRPGEKVTVKLYPLRNGRPGGVVLDVMDESGKKIGKS
jgi:hypothetical protein